MASAMVSRGPPRSCKTSTGPGAVLPSATKTWRRSGSLSDQEPRSKSCRRRLSIRCRRNGPDGPRQQPAARHANGSHSGSSIRPALCRNGTLHGATGPEHPGHSIHVHGICFQTHSQRLATCGCLSIQGPFRNRFSFAGMLRRAWLPFVKANRAVSEGHTTDEVAACAFIARCCCSRCDRKCTAPVFPVCHHPACSGVVRCRGRHSIGKVVAHRHVRLLFGLCPSQEGGLNCLRALPICYQNRPAAESAWKADGPLFGPVDARHSGRQDAREPGGLSTIQRQLTYG